MLELPQLKYMYMILNPDSSGHIRKYSPAHFVSATKNFV